MKKNYEKPIMILSSYQLSYSILDGSPKWNDVGNFGPGDKEDDDREGDDNWDDDWSWANPTKEKNEFAKIW